MTSFPRFDPHSAAHHPRDGSSGSTNVAGVEHPAQDFRNFRSFHRGGSGDGHLDSPNSASETTPCSIKRKKEGLLYVPPFIYIRARDAVCPSPPVKAAKVAKVSGAAQSVFEVAPDSVPHDWFEGVCRLIRLPCPRGVSAARWGRLQMDAAVFLETWGAQASALNWSTHNLFGVNQRKPFERVDKAGLVRLLDGRPVVAMTADEGVIQCPTGARQTFRRKWTERGAGQALLWELGDGQG